MDTGSLSPIHTADANETKLFCRVASAVCTWIRDDCRRNGDGFGDVNAAVGRDPVNNSAVNAIEVRYDVTYDAACF